MKTTNFCIPNGDYTIARNCNSITIEGPDFKMTMNWDAPNLIVIGNMRMKGGTCWIDNESVIKNGELTRLGMKKALRSEQTPSSRMPNPRRRPVAGSPLPMPGNSPPPMPSPPGHLPNVYLSRGRPSHVKPPSSLYVEPSSSPSPPYPRTRTRPPHAPSPPPLPPVSLSEKPLFSVKEGPWTVIRHKSKFEVKNSALKGPSATGIEVSLEGTFNVVDCIIKRGDVWLYGKKVISQGNLVGPQAKETRRGARPKSSTRAHDRTEQAPQQRSRRSFGRGW